jgi:hypothetical protein
MLALLAVSPGTGCTSGGRRPDLAPAERAEALTALGAGDPEAASYERVVEDGLEGGELRFVVSGRPEAVLAMLEDFDSAAGHRPWAEDYRTLASDAETLRARWSFRGKMGIDPEVELAFQRVPVDEGLRVDYRVVKRAFGLKEFRGSYELRALPGEPARTEVVERVFIDSGLPFVNASSADIEAGLLADARGLRSWMAERLAGGTPVEAGAERSDDPTSR